MDSTVAPRSPPPRPFPDLGATLAASYRPSAGTAGAYLAAAGVSAWVYFGVAEQALSCMLTVSVILQCLAYILLSIHVRSRGAAGVSARSLRLQALALSFRLSSTLMRDGYLPYDKSGDWLYQAFDMFSLVLLAVLLVQVRRGGHQVGDKGLNMVVMVIVAVILACIFHADMDHHIVYDISWTTGLFVDTVAMIPQLALVRRNGGVLSGTTLHFLVAMLGSRLISSYFWYLSVEDIVCTPLVGTFNHGGWGIVAAHAVYVLPFLFQGDGFLRPVTAEAVNPEKRPCC